MKAYFYCSYNLSPTGYQEVLLDTETGLQSRTPVHAEAVRTLLTHGGARSAIGRCADEYYLVLKDLRRTRTEVPADTPGRDWYLNCALIAAPCELADLCAIAYDAYTAQQAFLTRLTGCLSTREEGEASYAVDPEAWQALVKAADERYQAFLDSGEPDFSNGPYGLGQEQLWAALDMLRSREIEGLYAFVVLEGELDYFLSSNRCQDASQIRRFVKVGTTGAHVSRDEEKPESIDPMDFLEPGIVVGVGALVGVCVAAGAAVHFRKSAKRKRQRRKEHR